MDRELRRRAPGVFREKMTRHQVIEQNIQLGRQLEHALGQCANLKAKMVGYTKVFIHLLGGEARIPKHAYAEVLRDYDVEIKEPEKPSDDYVFILTKKEPQQEKTKE